MHRTGNEQAVIRRHRVSAHVKPDEIALVNWAGGRTTTKWDDYHQQANLDWMPGVEQWAQGIVADLGGPS